MCSLIIKVLCFSEMEINGLHKQVAVIFLLYCILFCFSLFLVVVIQCNGSDYIVSNVQF